jgi:hypothetical protein
MISTNAIILGLLLLVLYISLRWFSQKAIRKPARDDSGRLNRIRQASLLFQALTGIGFLLALYCTLALVFGWPFLSHAGVRIVISQNHIYTSRTDMPPTIFAYWLVKMGLAMAGCGVLFALFRLYGRGILFAARNVVYIRFLGYWMIIDWIVDYQMQGALRDMNLRDMNLSTTPVFAGLLIIFVAWIMDEGRKIREEQELTV